MSAGRGVVMIISRAHNTISGSSSAIRYSALVPSEVMRALLNAASICINYNAGSFVIKRGSLGARMGSTRGLSCKSIRFALTCVNSHVLLVLSTDMRITHST